MLKGLEGSKNQGEDGDVQGVSTLLLLQSSCARCEEEEEGEGEGEAWSTRALSVLMEMPVWP